MIINLLTYSKYIIFNKSNENSIQWSADHRMLYFHDRLIMILWFWQMIQDVITKAKQLLWQKLMWTAELGRRFSVSLNQMMNDMIFIMWEFFFMSQSSNDLDLNSRLNWMIEWMQQSSKSSRMQRDDSWKIKLVWQYLHMINWFCEMLLFCIHVSESQLIWETKIIII